MDGLASVVDDNGIGIEPKDIERIFEPFEQADSSICPSPWRHRASDSPSPARSRGCMAAM